MQKPTDLDLIITKPVSMLNQAANINFKEFFASLGKMTLSGATLNAPGAFEHAIDALKELGLQDKPEHVGWILISQALTKALTDQVEESKDLFRQTPTDAELEDLAERVEYTLNAIEVSIAPDIFSRPQDIAFLDDFKSALDFWLKQLGYSDSDQTNFHSRLKRRFAFALNSIWLEKPEDYKILESALQTPFTKATLEQRGWLKYNSSLCELANERVFNESFSLRQVYIRLNAYYEETRFVEDKDTEVVVKVAFDLHTSIQEWVNNFDKDNAIKLISGGPGSGKSSFSRILAAELAEKGDTPILFIQLQHFDPSKDLVQAIGDFVALNEFLTANPYHSETRQKRLLLIFDGLDELSMRGKSASEAAQEFVDEVIRTLDRSNSNANIKHQAIITGRELAIQSNRQRLRKPQQVFHMLPYFLSEREQVTYEDKKSVLSLDLRDNWWKMYGAATGHDHQAIPDTLRTPKLKPISREPLLNYLLALSYERKTILFDQDTTLNVIYEDLLRAVYERQWDHGGKHEATKHVSGNEFFRILEEIALAVWHGNGRTASKSEIYERCEQSNLIRYLDRFSEGAEKGVVRLLTAFYFREFCTKSNGDQVFEFTHKSFGEFLAAKRIVRTIGDIQEEVDRHHDNPDKGWNCRKALKVWTSICGKTQMNRSLFQFIRDEIVSQNPINIGKWQATFADMLGSAVRDGMPMEKIGVDSFSEMLKQSRNAEEGLLAVHSSCYRKTRIVISINWGDHMAFGTWWKRIVGQRYFFITPLAINLLDGLNLKECTLYKVDFSSSTPAEYIIPSPFVKYQNLIQHRLNSNILHLQNARLQGANLSSADLREANFTGADLRLANLEGCEMQQANLQAAELQGANMQDADLEEANLQGANLHGANLKGANLKGANLKEAKLQLSNLDGACLQGVNLQGARLLGSNYSDIDRSGTDLRNTKSV